MFSDMRELWWAITLTLLLGCATVPLYQGERLSKSEAASIDFVGSAVVESIDGRKPTKPWYSAWTKYQLEPGAHTMEVSYEDGTAFSVPGYRQHIEFTVEAGHTYKLWAEIDYRGSVWTENYWTAWIEDNDTGRVVGGTKTSEENNQAVLHKPMAPYPSSQPNRR